MTDDAETRALFLRDTPPNVDSHGGHVDGFGTIGRWGAPVYEIAFANRGGGPKVRFSANGLRAVAVTVQGLLANPLDTIVDTKVEPGDIDHFTIDSDRREAERIANPPPPPCPHESRVLVVDWSFYACVECEALTVADDVEEGPIYLCAACMTYGIGPDGRRCEQCNLFTAKETDAPHGVCPACLEAEVQPVAVLQCTACDDVIIAPAKEDG